MHAAKLCVAERLAAAARDLDAVEHVGERDGAAVGHVGVPVLPGVGEADRPAVLDDVGEDHDLRDAGLPSGERETVPSAPTPSGFECTSGVCIAFTSSACRRLTIGAGVPAGANTPYQVIT